MQSKEAWSRESLQAGDFRNAAGYVLCSYYFPEDVCSSHLELSPFTPIPSKPKSDTSQRKFKEEETEEK